MEWRSRAVREVIQEYTKRHTRLEAIESDAVATVVFDYEQTLVIGDLHTVQHDFEEIINTRCNTCITGIDVSRRSSVPGQQIEYVS